MQTLLIVFYSLLLLVLVVVTIVMFMYEWSLIVTRAPFISMPAAVLPYIVDALELKSGSVVYDLGCGEGRVLIAGWKRFPQASYIGLDKATLPIMLGWWRMRGLPKEAKIKLRKKNFFNQDLRDATHVFTYLFPGLMDRLLPKLKKELKPGTRLVSCDFQFTDMKPVRVIDMGRPVGVLGRTLYVYEF